MPPHSKVIYLIKIKGKAKIPDYVQLRDEDFTLIGYFRPGRNEKSVKTLDLTHVHDQIEESNTQFFGEYCPTIGNKFRILKNYKKTSLIDKYEKFISKNGIEIAGIEYIVDKKGEIYTYDINTNTNYNSQAEKSSEIKGMKSIAEFLKKELLALSNIKVVA